MRGAKRMITAMRHCQELELQGRYMAACNALAESPHASSTAIEGPDGRRIHSSGVGRRSHQLDAFSAQLQHTLTAHVDRVGTAQARDHTVHV